MAARLQSVKHARTSPGHCGKCHNAIKAGEPYRYWRQFRSRMKNIRCMKSECTPRPSELDTSLMSDVLAAQEDAGSAIAAVPDPDIIENGTTDADAFVDSIREAIQPVIDAIDAASEQYREQDNAFGGSGATAGAERADTLENASSTLGDWQPENDTPDACGEHDDNPESIDGFDPKCDECKESVSTWADEVRNSASSAVDEVELP